MDALAPFVWSLALLSIAGAGLGSVIGWREAANSLGRSAVIFIVLALALRLPWHAMLANLCNNIVLEVNYTFDGSGWIAIVVVGHLALVCSLLARRFFPRFTDERARGRARRRFDRDAGGGR